MNEAAYIGPLGGLIRIPNYQGGLTSQDERVTTEKVTTSGVRRMQVAQRTYREWSVSSTMDSSEAAQLAAIVAGEFGFGPFWFVDPWAQVTNLIGPRASMLEWDAAPGSTMAGPVDLRDGSRAGRSLVVSDPALLLVVPRLDAGPFHTPVIPGMPVTGSVYASGAGLVDIRLSFYTAAGAVLSSSTFSSITTAGEMARPHKTATAPDGAASVAIGVRGANRIARPAITWTSELMEYHIGQGAPSVAIPASLAQDIILATREARSHGRMASVSTTIREVG